MRLLLGIITIVTGCAPLLGIEEGEPAAGGGQASGGAGGDPSQIADWTESLTAVYRFELRPPDLGNNSVAAGPDLVEFGTLSTDGDAIEGEQSLVLASESDAGLQLASSNMALDAGPSFTVGAWVMVTGDLSITQRVIETWEEQGPRGYRLFRSMNNNKLICNIGDGEDEVVVGTADDTWGLNEWVFVVCRHGPSLDGMSSHVTSFIHSEHEAREGATLDMTRTAVRSGNAFNIGVDAMSIDGLVDEVFFVDQPLKDAMIRRIWACGIDGARCTCTDDGMGYLTCGNQVDCRSLPACDTPTPLGDAP